MTEKSDPLEEEVISSREIYNGRFLHLMQDEVRVPGGVHTFREYLRHPGAAGIVALLDNGNVIMERQWRHPLRRAFYEIPAGKLDPNEAPLVCAKRELIEETGHEAANWYRLGRFNNAIGYSNEEITIFLAKNLKKVPQKLDVGEVLEVIEIPWQELVAKCCNGEIMDVKTIVGALWLEKVMNGTMKLPE
ncbi:MAG: NUDIX hydrolase [Burkholderiales bacterium]|nr:NUDIX hydrolase [Burkholderiales bacterium]